MTYVFSHTTALEIARTAWFPRVLGRFCPASAIPRRLPASGEVESRLSSSSALAGLARPVSLLVSSSAGSSRTRLCEAHCLTAELPPNALLRLSDDAATAGPELLALQMASLATPLELTMLVFELCGLYAPSPGSEVGLLQRARPLTTLDDLSAFASRVPHIPGVRSLKRACDLAFELSASPMESRLACRVAWPRAKGGYGVPILAMNADLEVRRISRNMRKAQVRRPDILLSLPVGADAGLCLDYNGSVHESERRAKADLERLNELLSFGMRPFTIDHGQYESTAYMDGLVDGSIRRGLGLPIPRPSRGRASLELARREALLCELDAVDGMNWGTSRDAPAVRKALEDVEYAKARLRAPEGRSRSFSV